MESQLVHKILFNPPSTVIGINCVISPTCQQRSLFISLYSDNTTSRGYVSVSTMVSGLMVGIARQMVGVIRTLNSVGFGGCSI